MTEQTRFTHGEPVPHFPRGAAGAGGALGYAPRSRAPPGSLRPAKRSQRPPRAITWDHMDNFHHRKELPSDRHAATAQADATYK
jgi:hypothetical protein